MTDLAVTYKGSALTAFEPDSLAELIQLSEVMARSDMVPKDYIGKPGNIVVAGMAGRDLGLSLYQSLQSHAIISGRAMLWGDTPLALVRASGKLEADYPKEGWTGSLKDGTREAYCIVKRVGDTEEKKATFSTEDALTAGLWKKSGPWSNYPDRMMKMRARSFLLRDVFSDVLKGVAIAEEYEGIEERNVTPADAPVSGNDALKSKLAAQMGAAGITIEQPAPPPAPVEGVVEEPMPDFGKMLSTQIGEYLADEAHAREIPYETYKQLVIDTLDGKKLSRSTAPDVWRKIVAWVVPAEAVPAEEPAAGDQPALLDGAAE